MSRTDNNQCAVHDDGIEIYTLTCTWAHSYGAVLQAYALAKKINDIGWRTSIINYQPNYYNVGFKRRPLSLLYRIKAKVFDRHYLDFLRESEMITKKSYSSVSNLRRANLSASAFIVGSDQVWNCTKYYNGKDDAMFLDFTVPGQKRVSYAASLAMPEVPGAQRGRYRELLGMFDSISVREKTGAEALSKIGVKNVETVIDPVYLIGRQDWTALSNKSKRNFSRERYVLVLCLEQRDDVYEYAREKANLIGVKLYSTRNGARGHGRHSVVDRHFWNISVYDYLSIINNAEAVVADSFHAMSFALIFNRNVDIVPRNDNGNSRMVDLLSDLGIADRVTTSDRVIVNEINYVAVNKAIESKTNSALLFLRESLADIQ